MIKDLKFKSSVYEIQEVLLILSKELDQMYEKILQNLNSSLKPSSKELCLKMFRWVVCANRFFKLRELKKVLKLKYSIKTSFLDCDNVLFFIERDIEFVCESLLTISFCTVQHIHLSAEDSFRDWFIRLKMDETLQQYLVDVFFVSSRIVLSYFLSRCASSKVLSTFEIKIAENDVDNFKHRLFSSDYACFNWLKHFVNSVEVLLNTVESVIQSFFEFYCCLGWIQSCFNLDPHDA